MPRPIYKHVFQIVVLNDRREYDPDELAFLAHDIADGDSFGEYKRLSTDVVPSSQVADELVALGNDGSFFVDPFYEIENGSCDENCAKHKEGCDGYCDHLPEHINACLVVEATSDKT